jgi:hypothetical protein
MLIFTFELFVEISSPNMTVPDINFPATKTNTIKTEIENAYYHVRYLSTLLYKWIQ